MDQSNTPPMHDAGRWLVGAACTAIQPLLLNVLSLPATAYIIRSLGPSAYGQWMVANSLIVMCGFLINLGLRAAFVRSVARQPEWAPAATAEQLGLRFLLGLLAASLALLTCIILRYSATVLECTAIAAIGLLLGTIWVTMADLLQALQRLPVLATLNLLAGLILTITSVVVVALGAGPIGLSIAYLLGPVTSTVVLVILVHQRYFPIRVHWNLQRFWNLLKDSRFLAVQQCIAVAGNNTEVLLVPKLVGVTQFGFFSAGTSFADRLTMVPDGLATALYPAIAEGYGQAPEKASREVVRGIFLAILVCLPLAVLMAFCAIPVAQLLFPGQAAICRQVIWITVWSLPLVGIDAIMSYGLNAAGKDAIQARLSMKAGIWNILLAIILIHQFGLIGACWSWVLRYALRITFRVADFVQTFSPVFSGSVLSRILGCNMVMAALMGAIQPMLPSISRRGQATALSSHWASLITVLCIEGSVGLLAYSVGVMAFRILTMNDLARLIRRLRPGTDQEGRPGLVPCDHACGVESMVVRAND